MGSGGLSPNVADFHGRTALHLATSNAHLAIVQFLVAQPVRPRDAAGELAYTVCMRVARSWNPVA